MISLKSSRDVTLNKTEDSQSVLLGPAGAASPGREAHSVWIALNEEITFNFIFNFLTYFKKWMFKDLHIEISHTKNDL